MTTGSSGNLQKEDVDHEAIREEPRESLAGSGTTGNGTSSDDIGDSFTHSSNETRESMFARPVSKSLDDVLHVDSSSTNRDMAPVWRYCLVALSKIECPFKDKKWR